MNLPLSVCITGCDWMEILQQAFEVAIKFLAAEERRGSGD